MNRIKIFLIGIIAINLITACSSEDEIPWWDDNGDWQKIDCSLGVNQGIATTRTIGDLDNNLLPKGEYPSTLGIYLHKYANDDIVGNLTFKKETNIITKAASHKSNPINLFYKVNPERTQVAIKSPLNTEVLTFNIVVSPDKIMDGDVEMFFFASRQETRNIEFPKVNPPTDNWYANDYPDAREEFGDKLFSTDGFCFCWKDTEKNALALYLLVQNDVEGTEIDEVKEVYDFTEKELNITMKRMTACVSIRLVIVDHIANDGKYETIAPIDHTTEFKDAVTFSNTALQTHIEKNHPSLKEEMKDFNVRNIFIRKKLIDNYPYIYDWKNGLNTRERKALYLCNLDYPAWIDGITSYENGSNYFYGLTATCDNEPFIPATGKNFPRITLVLFMGIGEYSDDPNNKQGGTYTKVIRYFIDMDSESNFNISPNTHTYLYIPITLEDIVQLHEKLKQPAISTRSSMQDIILSRNQVLVVSEPLYSQADR